MALQREPREAWEGSRGALQSSHTRLPCWLDTQSLLQSDAAQDTTPASNQSKSQKTKLESAEPASLTAAPLLQHLGSLYPPGNRRRLYLNC